MLFHNFISCQLFASINFYIFPCKFTEYFCAKILNCFIWFLNCFIVTRPRSIKLNKFFLAGKSVDVLLAWNTSVNPDFIFGNEIIVIPVSVKSKIRIYLSSYFIAVNNFLKIVAFFALYFFFVSPLYYSIHQSIRGIS